MCAGIEIDPNVTRAQNGGRPSNSAERTDHRIRVCVCGGGRVDRKRERERERERDWTPRTNIGRTVPETMKQVLSSTHTPCSETLQDTSATKAFQPVLNLFIPLI